MTTQTKPTQPKLTIITPPALAAYAFVWQARPSLSPGGEPQFSITLLFDKKKADLTEMRRIAMNAAKIKFGDKLPKPLLSPFHDGDEEKPDDTLYAGKIYVNAKSRTKPGIVDHTTQPITNEFEFYSGCTCRASLYAFGYDTAGNKGVSFLLNNLQKLGDGERISGRKPAEEDFDAVEPEESEVAAAAKVDDDDFPF